ncbi:MAG: hypothetical protein HC857_10220 [Synechococcales cyanobacterium RU_4_20]|nr:hypothetical protein [Synechococcales cyanobacterium RU_4_20]NJR70494.1 hypothetical protein [Synechococcales cyanobacterium CRU_2_2]
MTITLTPEQEQLIQTQLASGKYTDLTDILTQALNLLLERDQANQKLEVMLLQGLDSGAPIPVTEEWWQQKKSNLTAQHQGH